MGNSLSKAGIPKGTGLILATAGITLVIYGATQLVVAPHTRFILDGFWGHTLWAISLIVTMFGEGILIKRRKRFFTTAMATIFFWTVALFLTIDTLPIS